MLSSNELSAPGWFKVFYTGYVMLQLQIEQVGDAVTWGIDPLVRHTSPKCHDMAASGAIPVSPSLQQIYYSIEKSLSVLC